MGIAKLKIDLGAVLHNYNHYKSLLKPDTKIMVVSKASSYGNGELEIVNLLESLHVEYIAVALAEEGVFFRQKGVQSKIMVFLTDRQDFDKIVDNQLEPSIFDPRILEEFIAFLSQKNIREYPIHIKIDTGMHRLGFPSDNLSEIRSLAQNDRVVIASVFSHLIASEDPSKDAITLAQIEAFKKIKLELESLFPHKILFHILNTRGITRFTTSQMDMVRLGIGMYGYSGIASDHLQNVSTLEADIISIKKVAGGSFIGYGGDQKTTDDCTIAILSIGYADGLSRHMGDGNGYVVLHGNRCPYIGNICMDIAMIDVTDTPCKVGDRVQIFGDKISVEEIAKITDTIPYEVFTSISKRVKRLFIE